MTPPTPHTVILYHARCTDGFGAAWAAWKALGDDGVLYVPVTHGDPPPWDLINADTAVYCLDFSYPRATCDAITEAAGSLLIIDHHKTAAEDLEDFKVAIIDQTQSGAVLAWKHFNPAEFVPPILKYIEDRDLWRWKMTNSREVNAWIRSVPKTFDDFDKAAPEVLTFGGGMATLLGMAILADQRRRVSEICEAAVQELFEGAWIPHVNTATDVSEVCEHLLEKHKDAPFAGAWSVDGQGRVKWSLRSRGDFDVSLLALDAGGGGHPDAAGFTCANPFVAGKGLGAVFYPDDPGAHAGPTTKAST